MIIEDIKTKQVKSRISRDSFRTGILTTLLGEVEKIGKDSGNRPTNDDESYRVIKKFIKNINETLKLTDRNSEVLKKELKVLNEFMPDETSDEDIKSEIFKIIQEMKNDESNPRIVIGPIMRQLKLKFENFDSKNASIIIKGELS
jgi:uncharacterized protein YqeY